MDTVGQDDDGDDSEVERRLEQLLLRIDADDVTEEQMNWTKIGTCLHFQLAPVLRKYIQPVVKNMYETLKSSSGIDCQTKDNFLVAYPPRTDENYTQIQDSYKLHYKNINNNNSKFAQHKERYVYSVTDEVELSKLFLPKQKETNYKDFERISLSSVLNFIINVSDFRHPLQLDARKVRDKIRNRWAHPEEHAWNGEQLSKFFAEIQQCIGSLQLPEEDHSKILHQVLCLRYCETRNTLKKDIRNLIEDVIYTRISSGDLQRCPECLRRDIVSQNQLENNNLEINDTNPEMVMELWVRVIKLYSWLKDEMKKPHALCVAAQLLSPDDAEVIHNSMSRLMAVDRLLKYILRHETVYLCKFLKISDLHLKNALKRKMEKVLLSKAEIEDCVRRNNQQIPDSNSFSLAEADKESILCKINTMKTIDFLNNGFLERFFVSLAEHDNVCEYLHKSEFANGASCLIDIVERRSYHVMYLLCDLLEQRQETGYIVERLGLRKKYCQARDGVTTETDDAEIGIYSTLQRKDNIDLKPTDFKVTGLELGSIIFRLCPRSTRSWEDLKRMCLSGDIINMLNNTFLDREILKWMSVDEPRLLLTIYSEESFDSTDKAQREAILKLNLISEESDSTELGCGSEDNPLQSNVDILCEELEINDDLIKLLKIKELVPSNISLELEQTHSRAAEIRCLLQKITFPEEGYKVIKEYLKHSNTYAYQALLQTENTSHKRKLTYKCEACLRHRADSGTQTSAKDIDTEDLHEKCADTIHKAWKITWSKCFFEQHDHGGEQNKPADKATSTGDGLWSAEISEDSGVETVEIRQISDEKTSKGKSANLDMDSKEDPTRVMSKEEIAPIDELDENQRRWLIIGIGLQNIVAPVLRETVAPVLQHLYDTLVKSCHIDTQLFPNHIKKHPATNTFELNYQSINNNKAIRGPSKNNSSYDYKVHNPVELSKLFLATNMALYTGFDESCDTSALLGILEKIDAFDPAARQAAEQTRNNVRNPWAHCNFKEWDETKYEGCFKNLNDLIRSLRLLKDKETETTEKLDDLKTHGIHNICGTHLEAKIQKLAAHVINIASKSRDNFVVKSDLDTIYNFISEGRAVVKYLQNRVQSLENVKGKPQTDIFLAPGRRETFTGRKEYLKQIKDILFKEGPDKQNKVTLCGLGGIGKTTIATEYAWRERSSYPGGVFWFSGETRESFENYIHRTAASIGMSGANFSEIYAKTLSWLSYVREHCLTILDNVDEDDITGSRLEFIHNTNLSDGFHHMVITSRRRPRDAEEKFTCKACIHVDKLSTDDSMELMKQRTSIRDASQNAELKEICILLDGLPLALEQAAVTIKSIECSFSSYLAEYRKENVALLKEKIVPQGGTTEDANRLSVNTTWIINLRRIDGKCQKHGFQLEMQLILDIISCLAGDDIPLEFFNVGNPPVEYGNLNKLLQNEIKLKTIIHILTEFSVLKKSGGTLTVHKLVQAVISNSIANDKARRIKIVQSATRMLHYAALLARENLDIGMIFRLHDQCNALQRNTRMWTTDKQTANVLYDLERKLSRYGAVLEYLALVRQQFEDQKMELNGLKEAKKSRTLTEEEKRRKEELKEYKNFVSDLITETEQTLKKEEEEENEKVLSKTGELAEKSGNQTEEEKRIMKEEKKEHSDTGEPIKKRRKKHR